MKNGERMESCYFDVLKVDGGRKDLQGIDLDALKKLSKEDRETIMRKHLGKEKCQLFDKYGLQSNDRLYWERVQEKYPTQETFSHKLAYKSSVLGLIFHMHRLCFAKVKYFENHWQDYQACKYIWKEAAFVDCELFDMEAIRQKATGIVIDLRDLSRIRWLSDFQEMCAELEYRLAEARLARGPGELRGDSTYSQATIGMV